MPVRRLNPSSSLRHEPFISDASRCLCVHVCDILYRYPFNSTLTLIIFILACHIFNLLCCFNFRAEQLLQSLSKSATPATVATTSAGGKHLRPTYTAQGVQDLLRGGVPQTSRGA